MFTHPLSVAVAALLTAASAAAMEDMGASGPSTPTTAVSDAKKEELKTLLPKDGFFGDLKLQQPVRFYDSANLYEYINGQAEGFIGYNFQALASATYAAGEDMVVVDIYDMEKPIQAFGVYSTFRSPANDFLEIGEQGFATAEGVLFHDGRFMVKVSADFADEEAMKKAAAAAARAAAEKIPQDRKGMEILDLLPRANKVANSEKYFLSAAMSQEFLPNGVVADYKVGEKAGRAFISVLPDKETAAKAYAQYLDFAAANAQGAVAKAETESQFNADVKYYGDTTVFAHGSYVAGAVGFPGGCPCVVDALKEKLANAAAAK
jgi:hypothetical protein